jgi:hypothetical protein
MASNKYFSKEEDDLVKRFYPTESPSYFKDIMPNRTYSSIRVRASRLGVKKDRMFYECTKRWDGDIFKDVDEKDIYYLAGFIDGEGCIRINQSKSRKVNYTPIHLSVTIVNTNKQIIDWIDKKTNNYGRVYEKKNDNPKHKNIFVWAIVGNRKVMSFLSVMKKYLIVKKEQAELLCEGYLHLSVLERESLIEKTKSLNKRGK